MNPEQFKKQFSNKLSDLMLEIIKSLSTLKNPDDLKNKIASSSDELAILLISFIDNTNVDSTVTDNKTGKISKTDKIQGQGANESTINKTNKFKK